MSSEIYLMVTIDTEEDNWERSRTSITVNNISNIPHLQEIFDNYGVKPIYLCDLPVISDINSLSILQNIHANNKCHIGTHLHPWNTPPLAEDFSEFNSYLENLPEELIKEKLEHITEKIFESFNIRPVIFRAGRWGVGKKVVKVLFELGYTIDTSITPFVDWQKIGTWRNFNEYPFAPYFVDPKSYDLSSPLTDKVSNFLEIPATIGFNKTPFVRAQKVYDILSCFPLRLLKVRGIAHRTGLLKKITLSPEQSSAAEMVSLAQAVLKNGTNLLNLTFHSTSLMEGYSPYVRSKSELKLFLSKIEQFLSQINDIGKVNSIGPTEINKLIDDQKIHSPFLGNK